MMCSNVLFLVMSIFLLCSSVLCGSMMLILWLVELVVEKWFLLCVF